MLIVDFLFSSNPYPKAQHLYMHKIQNVVLVFESSSYTPLKIFMFFYDLVFDFIVFVFDCFWI